MVIFNILSKTRYINKLHLKTIPDPRNWKEATCALTIKKIHLKNWASYYGLAASFSSSSSSSSADAEGAISPTEMVRFSSHGGLQPITDSMSGFLTDPRLDTGPPAPSALLHPERKNKA